MGSPDIREIIRKSIDEKSKDTSFKLKKSLPDFIQGVFKDPHGADISLKDFHRQMLYMMENYRRVLILAPRGSGKSSLASHFYPAYKIMQSRDTRIIIVSNTIDLAREWLRSLERTFTQNEDYKRLSGGDLVPDKTQRASTWTDTEKVVKGRSPHATHVTLKGVGVKGSLLGKRADIIICDDLLDPENTATAYQREVVSNWFHQVLVPILEPHGQLIVVGTRFAKGDLYEELWDSWTRTDANGNLYMKSAAVMKIVAEPEPEVSYWPERFPWEVLQEKKYSNSFAWSTQYMNDPVDLSGAFLKREWIEHYYESLPMRDGTPDLNYYVGMDPSVTGKGDATGICVVGVQPGTAKIYVVEMIVEKADLKMQAALLKMVCDTWKPVLVNVEANASQQIITQFLEENTMIPINKSQTRLDKAARMANLAAHFQNGRILLKGEWEDGKLGPSRAMKTLIEQWVHFRPKGTDDDALDALEKAVEVAAYVTDPVDFGMNPDKNAYFDQMNRKRHFRLFR